MVKHSTYDVGPDKILSDAVHHEKQLVDWELSCLLFNCFCLQVGFLNKYAFWRGLVAPPQSESW